MHSIFIKNGQDLLEEFLCDEVRLIEYGQWQCRNPHRRVKFFLAFYEPFVPRQKAEKEILISIIDPISTL